MLTHSGLSPRVRGNPVRVDDKDNLIGSIPACAGEPRKAQHKGCTRTVYPRVCGGTYAAVCAMQPRPGLSPRVRGNLLLRVALDDIHGSIPACAGEPSPSCTKTVSSTVYPRVCGGTPRSESV